MTRGEAATAQGMSRADKHEKFFTFLFMISFFAIGYVATNQLAATRTVFLDLATDLDRSIPFMPASIFGYLFVYVSVLVGYAIIDDIRQWRLAAVTFLFSTSIAYVFFLLVPVRMALRPDVGELGGLSEAVTRLYFAVDLPYNCFPSLHVTYPAFLALIVWPTHIRARWLMAAMALVVAGSVLLVKQHYVADVAGGLANATICWWLATKTERFWPELGRWLQPVRSLCESLPLPGLLGGTAGDDD